MPAKIVDSAYSYSIPVPSKLNRDSETPLYLQLASQLVAGIQDKRWLPLEKLPSEYELTRLFGVSRVTVRQATRVLVERGLAVSKQGKGVYVRGPQVNQDLAPLRGFYDGLIAQGYCPETEVVEFQRADDVVVAGQVQALGNAIQYVRLYRVEGIVIAVADITVFCFGASIGREQVESLPVYSLLHEVVHKKVARSTTRIRATGMQPSISARLGLSSEAGLLQMDRTSYDEQGLVLETSRFYIRPDVFAFEIEAAGPFQVASGIRRVANLDVDGEI